MPYNPLKTFWGKILAPHGHCSAAPLDKDGGVPTWLPRVMEVLPCTCV